MRDQCVFLLNGLELLEGIRLCQQSMDPHNTDISSLHHLLFASNSATFELTNTAPSRGLATCCDFYAMTLMLVIGFCACYASASSDEDERPVPLERSGSCRTPLLQRRQITSYSALLGICSRTWEYSR